MDATAIPTQSWYVAAMERLVVAVQDLSHARDLDAVMAVVRGAARSLTGADGATFVLRDGDQCYYAEENAIAPLWKGQRFPMSQCVSGWVMLNAQSAIIEDIYADPRVPADAYRPTFVKSLVMVPIRRSSPIGAIGNYWSTRHLPSAEEISVLQALADTTSVALENADLYTRLCDLVQTLQDQRARLGSQHDSLTVFTRALAHDLREPVRTLISFSDMLLERPADAAKRDTYLRFIGESAARMGKLIDSVSHYTRLDDPEEPVRTPCDLAGIIADVRQNLAYVLGERKARLVHGPLPVLVADPVHLVQLFQNLIANAVVHNDRPVTVTIAHEVADGRDMFSVSDDGEGISPSQVEEIFEPFRRLVHANESSGLGLAICRRVVARYGGEIRCESPAGCGATFRFTLPRADLLVPDAPDTTAGAAAPVIANVLIVDDREADLELTEMSLFERPGLRCHLHSARDGQEAHDLLAAGGSRIDLVLLDINMPVVDGFTLLERMRGDDALSHVPVIMCSGSDYEPDRRRASALGAAGYLLKPPKFAMFRQILGNQPGVRLLDDPAGLTLVRAAG